MNQYPTTFNPPNRGTCRKCGCETRAHDPRWLERCPEHWQALARREYVPDHISQPGNMVIRPQ